MMKFFGLNIIFFLLFIAGSVDGQQNSDKVQEHLKIEHADSLVNISTQDKEIIELWGNVRMVQGDAYLQCDSSRWWKIEDKAILLGNVKIYDGKRTLYADRVDYDGKTRSEMASGHVVLQTKNRNLNADELTYSQEHEIASAKGNIRIHDFIENAVLKGHSGYYNRITDFSKIEIDPILVMVDSVSNDTLTIRGLHLEAWGENERFMATDSVLIEKNDMKAVCQKANYSADTEILKLDGFPIVWQNNQEMKGDTILIQLEGVNFSGGEIIGKGEIISIDSTGKDILKGQHIDIIASNDTIRQMILSDQASSIYHVKDQESGEEGVNSVSGDRIIIFFTQGELERVKVTSQPGQSSGIYKPDLSINSTGKMEKTVTSEKRKANVDRRP